MQCGHVGNRLPPAQRKMHVINMKMNDVELCCALEDMFQHQNLVCELVDAMFVYPQRATARRNQARFGH